MLNNLILVGRLVDEPVIVTLESGYKVTNLVLAVQRPFRNEINEYETDFIPVQAWMSLSELICEYAGKGSILGFKCRLSTRTVDVGEVKLKSLEVIAERVSFISLKPRTDKSVKTKRKESEEAFLDSIPKDEEVIDIIEDDLNKEDKKKTKKEVK